ncbi:MAG TPA: hypothetical protein VFC94_05955 [Bacteroidaceae bacterium]|nr:hypothetical protein [Bacteroidaceae bacterium]
MDIKKLSFLLAISFISFNFSNAQIVENNAIYVTSELNFGNYLGMDLDLNYILKDKYSFKVGYSGNFRKPKSQPDDFTTGIFGIFLFGTNSPADKFENFGATVGRIYKINQSGTIRANLSLGVGYTIYTEPENWEKINDNVVSLSKNYTYDYVEHRTISLIVNPKIEFPIIRYWGLSVSPMLQINRDRAYFGIGLGTMIGLLR